MPSLELVDVTKRFKRETVLDGASLRVESGETVAIFGASGGGKTVLLRMVAGVEEPTSGQVLIDGQDVRDVPPERRGVGMAFQNFALFPHMSAFENIASPLRASAGAADKVRDGVQRVARLLKIDHVLDHTPRALSNGQKQRTALARALSASPELVLLDDPLRNVDAKLRFEMRLELPRVLEAQGATVLLVTQDYKEAMALGTRIAVLDGGRFVQVGTPREIYLVPANVAVARLFGDPSINLLEAEVRSGEAQVAGATLTLPAANVAGHCQLGMRPEALRFEDEAGDNVLSLEVEAVTPLNEKRVTLLAGPSGEELLVSRPANEPAPSPGQVAHVAVPPESVLLFDASNGERVAGGSGA